MNTHRLLSWQVCTRLISASLMLFACGSAVANVSLWVSNHGTDSGTAAYPPVPVAPSVRPLPMHPPATPFGSARDTTAT